MANNEASFQTELLKEMHRLGWHAFKVSKLSFGGVPDLYVKAPSKPGVWIELKYNSKPTPLQMQFINKEVRAGGYAGWVSCVKSGREWHLSVNGEWIQTRGVGEKWNVHRLVEAIIG